MACLFIYLSIIIINFICIYLFMFYYHVFTGIVWCYYYYYYYYYCYYYYYYYYYYHYIFTKYLLVIFFSSVASVASSLCFLCQEPECLVALGALVTHVYSSFIHRYIFTGIIRHQAFAPLARGQSA